MTLAKQFFLAGGIVTAGAVLLVSLSVTNLIAQAVTRNAAAATALYVDSIIAPILPDLSTTQEIDPSVERALDETLSHGALGRRLVSFRLWSKDGKIIYSNDKKLMGLIVPPSEDRQSAFRGELVANYEEKDEDDNPLERESGGPLLEIYNPVLQPWSGEVVAVAEFYEDAEDVGASLTRVLLLTWLSILSVLALFFLVLSLIVFRGSSTIEAQRKVLKEQIADLDRLLRQNTELGKRVQKASQQTAALNEQFLRKVGADIHDGPVQLLAYATMRVDSPAIRSGVGLEVDRKHEVGLIKRSLEDAIHELRSICRGLVLPEIENLPIEQVLDHVVSSYRSRTGADVSLVTEPASCSISPSARICAYRFVQEALNNGWLHAQGKGQFVEQRITHDMLTITVGDEGPGFDLATVWSGRLGLSGMRERIESIGGRFKILTSSSGTILTMFLTISETSAL
ncbi:sensor histidine kinase [Rhizobium rhizophilum]|uniref:Sensor histidine kinase n=2 Tax=Rhizobium rhizophilum TaxID=1850373 RepID=A0ABY2QSJ2_9HYPH|nr:sensor histidine kinase [Rhizobium rhizophilum]